MAPCILVLVDGPNLFNDAGRLLQSASLSASSPSTRSSYYRTWFDVDRLVGATLSHSDMRLEHWTDLGIVIVHSRKGLGSDKTDNSVQGEEAVSFWARQGSNPNTSTLLVDIPGAPQGKEKGIDTTIVIYLFETLAQWDAAVLFSNDTDFVPAVWSLRRRGKRVYCSSHISNSTTPLVQACQHFLPWDTDFLSTDIRFFEALQPGGLLDEVLTGPLRQFSPRAIFPNDWGLQIEFADVVPPSALSEAQSLLSTAPELLLTPSGGNVTSLTAKDQVRPTSSDPCALWIMPGVRRHHESFADAQWKRYFR